MTTNNAQFKNLKTLSTWLDSRFKGPFGMRFGLDALLGLIPVVGDLVTTFTSFYILMQAAQMGCSPSTIVRMGINIAIENFMDMFPVLGNIFDFFWKANNKNISLIERHLNNPRSTSIQSRFVIGFTILFVFSFIIGTAYVSFLVFRFLFELVASY